jgi:hypothetical protein
MKHLRHLFIAFSILLFSCSKGGDTPAPTPTPTPTPTPVVTETAFTISVNVDPGGNNILGVVGTSQPVVIKISSPLPSAGVTVSTTVIKDADNSTVYSNSIAGVAGDNTITISGLAPGVLCTASILVASKSSSTNSKLVTFKLAAK